MIATISLGHRNSVPVGLAFFRLQCIRNPNNELGTFTYDVNGKLSEYLDSTNRRTTFSFSGDDLIGILNPDGSRLTQSRSRNCQIPARTLILPRASHFFLLRCSQRIRSPMSGGTPSGVWTIRGVALCTAGRTLDGGLTSASLVYRIPRWLQVEDRQVNYPAIKPLSTITGYMSETALIWRGLTADVKQRHATLQILLLIVDLILIRPVVPQAVVILPRRRDRLTSL